METLFAKMPAKLLAKKTYKERDWQNKNQVQCFRKRPSHLQPVYECNATGDQYFGVYRHDSKLDSREAARFIAEIVKSGIDVDYGAYTGREGRKKVALHKRI